MRIRDEAPGDIEPIRAVIGAAFARTPRGSGSEAAIVEALRDAGALTVSLVADEGGAVIGHVAFSPVTIDGASRGWFGLGPIAVRPERQRGGAGGTLIRRGLDRLTTLGAEGCVVLGDPGYYRRFGFVADPALRYPGARSRYFQRYLFSTAPISGVVAYHPGFAAR